MKYFYALLLVCVTQMSFAQIKKYILTDGSLSNNPDNAAGRVEIEKINDTTYIGNIFDSLNNLIVEGTYKDSLLTIANGKFQYQNTGGAHTIGYYLNRKKTGTWYCNGSKGEEIAEWNYNDGILNGKFKNYNTSLLSPLWAEGNMINGKLEGEYNIFNQDGTLMYKANYLHNKRLNEKYTLQTPKPSYNLKDYLEKRLIQYKKLLSGNGPIVKIKIDSTGKIKDVKIVQGVSPAIDSLFISSISSAPNFVPAKLNKVPVNFTYNLWLFIFIDAPIDYDNKFMLLTNTIDIGNGTLVIRN